MHQPANPARRRLIAGAAAGASLTILSATLPAAFGKAPMAGSQVIRERCAELISCALSA